jgi:multisubunit Na+/H+ antiporter MnhG subunit
MKWIAPFSGLRGARLTKTYPAIASLLTMISFAAAPYLSIAVRDVRPKGWQKALDPERGGRRQFIPISKTYTASAIILGRINIIVWPLRLNRIENSYTSMNATAKVIIGIIVALAGVAWYIWGGVFSPYIGMNSLQALGVIIAGSFGIFLIMVGLLVAWLAWEER